MRRYRSWLKVDVVYEGAEEAKLLVVVSFRAFCRSDMGRDVHATQMADS
jgi:hypothetical protein